VEWLHAHGESGAGRSFEKYWTGDRGNWTKGHGGVGGTNNNNGTEGRWGGAKKFICGNSGSTAGLAMRTVMQCIMRYLQETSKEEASYWRADNSKRKLASKYTFSELTMAYQRALEPARGFASVCAGAVICRWACTA